ncbi:Lipoprotein OS=Afipia felis OX=1035 GN=NCTC12722_02661 PE=4 SV=1 [Afipia felis]
MRKLIAVAAMLCGLALAGCQTTLPSLNISNAVAMNTVYGIENAYGIAVNAANAYKALPLCKTGTTPSATNICARRSVIVNLQNAMGRARLAVNNAVAFQKAYPTLDVTNVVAAAQTALNDVRAVLASGAN